MKMNLRGALSHRNWHLLDQGAEISQITEFPLYSDARILGDLSEGFEPYEIVNAFGNQLGFSNLPTMLLRMTYAKGLDEGIPQGTETSAELYHGAGMEQEIAALVSLSMGIKVKSGNPSRIYEPDGGRFGIPLNARTYRDPIVITAQATFPFVRNVLPRSGREHSLDSASAWLKSFPRLTAESSIDLIRVARIYQEAIWLSEADPALSWLLFVSAVESAAVSWNKKEMEPIEKLRKSKADLTKRLIDEGSEELAIAVAESFNKSMGVTQKFVGFLVHFLPPPPPERPLEMEQIKWSKSAMREAFSKIYDYRSKALHEGRPFPQPICEAPLSLEKVAAERPFAPAMGNMNAMWNQDDLPMYLHTFEYIVRNALINWWKSILPNSDKS